jgi:hypothetical protein
MNFKKTVAIAAAAGALTALAIPAMAETTLYGSARMATFYNLADTPAGGKTAGFDEHLQLNSRFGANFSNGDVGGKFELGAVPNIRLLYGTWNFGSGKLTVGQDYNSYYTFTEQVHFDDNGLNGYGALWDTRQAQIRVNLNNGLYFAAIQPTVNVNGDTTGANAELASGATDTKMYLPKLNVGYAGKAGMVGYNVGVVGTTFSQTVGAGTTLKKDQQIVAVLGYANGSAAFGATKLMASVSGSQNAGNMNFYLRKGYDAATKKDAIGFEGYIQASQKVSDTLTANIGLGYAGDKIDAPAKAGVAQNKFDDKMVVFVNTTVTLAKNVCVTPEFDYYNQMNGVDGKDSKMKAYAIGAQWKINF